MILAETHADLREGSKTASPQTLSMENSCENSTSLSLSEMPAGTSSSEVPSATDTPGEHERLRSFDDLNPSVPGDAPRPKSNHPGSPQDSEGINPEHLETEDLRLLMALRQWKEICSNFFFPLLLFGFIVLGLQFTSSLGMTVAGQMWYRYSAFLCFLIFCTGLVTELAYEELGFW